MSCDKTKTLAAWKKNIEDLIAQNQNKLDGIEEGANNYIKPINEPMAYIAGLTTALEGINTNINNIITLLGTDNVSLDTLQEIVDFIEANRATLEALGVGNIIGLQTILDGLQTQINNFASLNTVITQFAQSLLDDDTQAEALATLGAEPAFAILPLAKGGTGNNLGACSVLGTPVIATLAEVNAGTVTTKVVVPATLQAKISGIFTLEGTVLHITV